VELSASNPVPENSSGLIIRATTSAQPPDLEYVWFADSGRCEPQRSSEPTTQFQFAGGAAVDRVSVEVWRHGERLAQNQIQVTRANGVKGKLTETPAHITVEITDIPVAGVGSPDSKEEIRGKVNGADGKNYRVVVYAHDEGVWYVQPYSRSTHAIDENHAWATWTHAGSAYSALVVNAGYVPARTLNSLPPLGGDILGCTVVDGRTN
jgi:hypothetical protein